MIVTIANVKIQPAKREEFLAALPGFVSANRAEKGCIAYDIVETFGEPNAFMTVERWEDRASLDAHLGAAHTQVFVGLVGGVAAAAPSIEAFNVSSVDRLM